LRDFSVVKEKNRTDKELDWRVKISRFEREEVEEGIEPKVWRCLRNPNTKT